MANPSNGPGIASTAILKGLAAAQKGTRMRPLCAMPPGKADDFASAGRNQARISVLLADWRPVRPALNPGPANRPFCEWGAQPSSLRGMPPVPGGPPPIRGSAVFRAKQANEHKHDCTCDESNRPKHGGLPTSPTESYGDLGRKYNLINYTHHVVLVRLERSPSDRPADWLDNGSDVLPRGAETEAAVGVNLLVIGNPAFDGGKGSVRVGDGIDADVIALEGFDERLGDAVAFGAFDRGEAGTRSRASVRSTVLSAA